jgi:uncharacterized membrane protein YidH (DUF202 family)
VIGSLIRVGAFAATRLPRRWTVEQPPVNAGRPIGQAAPGSEGAPRRTSLAAERTYLAWLRTGLGAIGVALAVGRLIPALLGGSRVAYATLGAGYGVLGAFIIAYAVVRVRRINAALEAGGPVAPDWWAVIVVTAMSLALALATIVMVLVSV